MLTAPSSPYLGVILQHLSDVSKNNSIMLKQLLKRMDAIENMLKEIAPSEAMPVASTPQRPIPEPLSQDPHDLGATTTSSEGNGDQSSGKGS